MKLTSLFFISCLFTFNTAQAGIFSHRAADSSPTSQDSNGQTKGPVDKRLDYKLTFKVPYLYNGSIPFWSTSGDLITAADRIRLSPSVPGTKGSIWSEFGNYYPEWMVDMNFRVTGNQLHGGRGMAFWYTKDKLPEGPIFGAQDQWDGLSIWFDSANPKTHAPTVMAFLNDGKFAFASAGVDPTTRALATCSIDYRNPNDYVKMRLTYKANTLTLMLDPSSHGMNFRPCFHYTGITLPAGYHFGVTAASHNPADDHDVLSFETYQVNPPQKIVEQKRPLEDEKTRQGEGFTELSKEQLKGVLFDTERRILETLQISQLQLEALGAPTPEQVLSGNFEQKSGQLTQQQDSKQQTR
ncbi:legume-like lectin family-domain-containing protein [Chlamydoabsidia padenii]|nr:legume-like lectin family-domain-containing protein [Chlamydoabsidia padenii]